MAANEEGLSWVGDEPEPVAASPRRRAKAATAGGAAATAAGSAAAGRAKDRGFGGSVLLVLYGVFAGVGLLYTLAWLFSALRFAAGGIFADPLPAAMYTLGLSLAVLAPAFWAVAVFAALRGRAAALRLLWLLLGALVLVPWPWILGVR